MSKYKGLYTFDVDNHRYLPVGQADVIIDCFKFKHELKEPLIKDEKVRKAVRAWAEANDMSSDSVVICGSFDDGFETDTSSIEFDCTIRDALRGLKRGKSYTIAELCGEEKE